MTTITRIADHGTIVAVHLSDGDTVFFDHRPFAWLVEAEGADNIIGREVFVGRSSEGAPVIVFREDYEGPDGFPFR